MTNVKSHIRQLERTVLIWMILFALAPCAVKAVFTDFIQVDYQQPLNKSKTTSSVNNCQYPSVFSEKASVTQKNINGSKIEPFQFLRNKKFISGAVKLYKDYPKNYSGNSPPKYILFKRLKIDIA